jgi:hypothetical protein
MPFALKVSLKLHSAHTVFIDEIVKINNFITGDGVWCLYNQFKSITQMSNCEQSHVGWGGAKSKNLKTKG